jgi:hypothetical protein
MRQETAVELLERIVDELTDGLELRLLVRLDLEHLLQIVVSALRSELVLVRIVPVADQKQKVLERLATAALAIGGREPRELCRKLQVLELIFLDHADQVEHLDRRDERSEGENSRVVGRRRLVVEQALRVHNEDRDFLAGGLEGRQEDVAPHDDAGSVALGAGSPREALQREVAGAHPTVPTATVEIWIADRRIL